MSDIQGSGGPGEALPFIYGHVDPSFFPTEQLAKAAQLALAGHGQSALNYGASLGCGPLRDYLRVKFARDEGLALAKDELLITAGASAGLDLAIRLFTRPGDTVLVEAPSYHEALAIIRDYPVKLAAIPLDREGLDYSALADKLDELVSAGERPALLYTIPTFQNPSGVTMQLTRRQNILKLATHFQLPIVEDDVYYDLHFQRRPPPSLFSLSKGNTPVIRLGSFSKILAPGLRLGWAMGPAGRIEQMAECGLAQSGGGANPYVAYCVAAFCQQGWLEPHISRLRQNYRERRDIVLASLKKAMPGGVTWTKPKGGFFVWLTLPEPLSAADIRPAAQQAGINFLTGEPFFAQGGGRQHIRLPYSFIARQDLSCGIELLAEIIRQSVPSPD